MADSWSEGVRRGGPYLGGDTSPIFSGQGCWDLWVGGTQFWGKMEKMKLSQRGQGSCELPSQDSASLSASQELSSLPQILSPCLWSPNHV